MTSATETTCVPNAKARINQLAFVPQINNVTSSEVRNDPESTSARSRWRHDHCGSPGIKQPRGPGSRRPRIPCRRPAEGDSIATPLRSLLRQLVLLHPTQDK